MLTSLERDFRTVEGTNRRSRNLFAWALETATTSPSAGVAGVSKVYYFGFEAANQPESRWILTLGMKKPSGEPDGLLCER